MNETTNKQRPIVVGVDGSDAAGHALSWAMAEAAMRNVPLEVVHVWRESKMLIPDSYDPALAATGHMSAAALDLIDRQITALPPDTPHPPEICRREVRGFAGHLLIEASRTKSLVVVGRQGVTGYAHEAVAPKVFQLVHHAECPVAVVPVAPWTRGHGVVVGIDGSEAAATAAAWACDEARRRGTTLTAVLAWGYPNQYAGAGEQPFEPGYTDDDARTALDEMLASAVPSASLDAISRLTVNDLAGGALVEAGRGAELLVVGSRGRGGFRGLLLGSVSHRCLTHAPCPTVVVR